MTDHVTYPSVEAMVAPSVLSGLLGRPVTSVELVPMTTAGDSTTEAAFAAIRVDGEETPSFVLKRIRWSLDWFAISSEDTVGRELAIWETGVLDRLPPAMGHAVRAVARFEDGAALLMDDLGAHLLPDGDGVTKEQALGVLRGMAAMHARFLGDPPVAELGAAFNRFERMLTALSQTNLRALGRMLPDNELIATLPAGWDRLPDLVDPGLARDMRTLANDPTPMVAALERYPATLLHGDLRAANVAWDGARAIAIDWQPTAGPPAHDLAYFLQTLGVTCPLHPDEAMGRYHDMLRDQLPSGVSTSWWDDQLDVCIAAVKVMMASLDALFRATEHDADQHPHWTSHEWWVERSMRGLRLIAAA